MQTRSLKILLLLLVILCLSPFCHAQHILKTADSLFTAKQYTQSFDLYHTILESKRYSPAMLLKMAYIQEGLGHTSQSIHYLQLYEHVTHDEQATKKIEDLAGKKNLEGYTSTTDETFFLNTLQKYSTHISALLLALIVFFLVLMVQQKRKHKEQKPLAAAFALLFVTGLLFAQVNILEPDEEGIVSANRTYLMSGPSAGASVIAVINEGHQLKIKGQNDVWLKVQWKDKIVFVKEEKLLRTEL